MKFVDEAIRLAPKNAGLFAERAALLHKKGENEQAIANLNRAIEFDPGNAEGVAAAAAYFKGRIFALDGNMANAASSYSEAITLDPEQLGYRIARAEAFGRLREFDKALADLDHAVKSDAKGTVALNERADLFRVNNKPARAIDDYNAILVRQPNNLSVLGSRGVAYFMLGDFAKASEDFAKIASEGSAYGVLWLHVSRGRSGGGAPEVDLKGIAGILPAKWPMPIVEMFLGKRSVASAISVAGSSDERCEVEFFAGQLKLRRDDRAGAKASFQFAQDKCPHNFLEFSGAVAELQRM
jgi:tetratricopeptide (TPR) repeat protein